LPATLCLRFGGGPRLLPLQITTVMDYRDPILMVQSCAVANMVHISVGKYDETQVLGETPFRL